MKESELFELLEAAADAAFIVAPDGVICFWNKAAEELFGVPTADALGRSCAEVIQGTGTYGGRICEPDCYVLQMARRGNAVPCFDLEVKTASGTRPVNISILQARTANRTLAIHLVREAGSLKKLERITRLFVEQIATLTGHEVEELLRPLPPPHSPLTPREGEILKLLATGRSTRAISAELGVRPATLRNHIQNILRKLDCHSRMEAVLRLSKEGKV